MSKARDLASQAPTPSTVSATELGYLDGVTSAVQTQIDSKIGQSTAINPTIVDAKGDILTATADNTPARLGVGANDTVLTADSTTATGLKWATPAAGGMTLISTTTLSGASVSLTSIPQTYKQLVLIVRNYLPVNSNSFMKMRYNSDTATRYACNDLGVSVGGQTYNTTYVYAAQDGNSNTVSQQSSWVTIPDYTNTTTWKYSTTYCVANNSTTTTSAQLGSYYGIYNQTAAISSIQLSPNTGNFTSGTVLLYGVS